MTASAFSLSYALPSEALVISQGELVLGGVQGETQHNFCAFCKTWLFTRPAGLAWLVNLRASSLDDHSDFEPFAEFWTREKLAWVKTPARYSYETLPPDDGWEGLMKAYGEYRAG